MSKRIIVVDDSREVREIATFVLRRNGFDVLTAANGMQLRRYLADLLVPLPDLIILDVMMPGEDGYHICSELRKNPRTSLIPLMIITAHEEAIYQRISGDLGVAQHLTKPFHPLELAERVKAIWEI